MASADVVRGPGAGAPPPELVGRDPVLEQARMLLGRAKLKRHEAGDAPLEALGGS
jgi:hypothetical protein